MTDAIPPWRRMSPKSRAARGAGITAALVGFAALGLLVAAPLYSLTAEADARARRVDERAAALTAAAAARRAEASVAEPSAADVSVAIGWLDERAPIRSADDAALDLLSSLRLIAEDTGARLDSAVVIDASRGGDAGVFDLAGGGSGGVGSVVAEARLRADHAGLARFLAALEAASPPIRAAAVEITSRSAAADQEPGRLAARVTVGALMRAPAD